MLSEKEKAIIAKMRLQGEGYTSIANELSMNVSTVRKHCVRNHLTDSDVQDCSVCVQCGAAITQPGKGRRKIFCSEKCRSAFRRSTGQHKETVYHHICKRCGKEFDTVGNKNQKYCSSHCYHEQSKTKAEKLKSNRTQVQSAPSN